MQTTDVELRRRWPQLPTPLVRPWSEQPVLVRDRGRPWVYGPIECDPGMTDAGLTLPRHVIRRLAELAALELPFQRLAIAPGLDPAPAVGVGGARRDGRGLDALGGRLAGPDGAGRHARRPSRGGAVARRRGFRAARRNGPADRRIRRRPPRPGALRGAVRAR